MFHFSETYIICWWHWLVSLIWLGSWREGTCSASWHGACLMSTLWHNGIAFIVGVCLCKLYDEASIFLKHPLFLHPSALQLSLLNPIHFLSNKKNHLLLGQRDRAPLYVCIQRRAQTKHPPPTQQPPHTPSIKNRLQTRPPFSTEEGPSV